MAGCSGDSYGSKDSLKVRKGREIPRAVEVTPYSSEVQRFMVIDQVNEVKTKTMFLVIVGHGGNSFEGVVWRWQGESLA